MFFECNSTYMGYSEVTYPGDVHRYYGYVRIDVPIETQNNNHQLDKFVWSPTLGTQLRASLSTPARA